MPTVNLGHGRYRYGKTGKVYSGAGARGKAMRQGRAIELSKLVQEGRATVRGGKTFVKANETHRAYIKNM